MPTPPPSTSHPNHEIELTGDFWDCACDTHFIHHRTLADCPLCETQGEDAPDSRINEVAQHVGEVVEELFAQFTAALDDLLRIEAHVRPTPFVRDQTLTFEGVRPYVTFVLEKYLKGLVDPDPMGYRAEVDTFRTTPRPDTLNVFTVTPAHLAMLKRLSFVHDWGDYYLGGAAVSRRRPYGNSDLYGDLAELAGIPAPNWDAGEDWTEPQIQHMLGLHYDMAQVLNMAVERYPEPLTPGLYARKSPLWSWLKMPEVPEHVLVFETYGACPHCETDANMDGRDCLACDYQAERGFYVWVCPLCSTPHRLDTMPPTVKCPHCQRQFKVANFIPPAELLVDCQAEDSWLEAAYEDRFELGDWE